MKLATKLGVFTVRSGAPALLLALAITHVCAQEPPPPDGEGFPPPPDGAGDFGGPPPGGPQRQMRRTMPLTPAIVPASAFTTYLYLSADQLTRLADILERLRVARPRPGGGRQSSGGSADATPAMPTREEMEAARLKFDAAIKLTNQEIASLLDEHQTKRLSTLMKAFKALQSDSISLNAAARLRLTDRQIESLAALGASPTRAVVTESFTAEQLEIADLNRTQVRRGPPGGGGPGGQGFGPPPGGGPGFGPPDGGGPPF